MVQPVPAIHRNPTTPPRDLGKAGVHLGRVAIVDDDPISSRVLRAHLDRAGFQVDELRTGTALLSRGTEGVAVACVDLGLEDMDGLDLIVALRAADPDLTVIVVTAKRDVDSVVRAMQLGAYDFITKPFDADRVVPAVTRGRERWELSHRVHRLEQAIASDEVLPALVGSSPAAKDLARQVDRVVSSDVSVCLFGESGSGKEVVARAIHAKSSRRDGPFVALNCAAIPPTLQESELFGHERGAFTGAHQTHHGRFEQAKGGTLFLDELGEMSPGAQASLLRTLQELTIRRVGGTVDIPIDARIVCATHRDLRAEVAAGRFREDLYFRLVVYPIRVPALRERLADIPALVAHFAKQFDPQLKRRATPRGAPPPVKPVVKAFTPEAIAALQAHSWPGNVRELRNVVHRALLNADGDRVEVTDLPDEIGAPVELPVVSRAEVVSPILAEDEVIPLVELERRAIRHALRTTRGKIGAAAKLLGLGRATLYRKLAALDIPEKEGAA
ncbi:MAG: sigma-54 dependent transcriptional regulator [Polyangiaceae bacterium]